MQAGRSHLHSHYSERPAIATPMGGVCPQQRQVRNCLTRHRFARADTRALFGRKAQHRLRARPPHRRPPAIRLAPRRPTAHRYASHTSYRALLRCMSRCRGHAPSDNRMTHHSNFAGESHARKQRIDTATCTGARRLSNAHWAVWKQQSLRIGLRADAYAAGKHCTRAASNAPAPSLS